MKGLTPSWWKPLSQLCFFLFPLFAAAESGDALVTRLGNRYYASSAPDRSLVQKVTLITPARLLPDCPSPQLQLASYGRLSGNMSVTARCLPSGTALGSKDVARENGELTGQPRNVIFATQPVTGSFTTRAIQAGQPLTANMLRAPWKVRPGNPVAVVTRGPGFRVRHYGKAMSDAAVGSSLRVRLASGKMVSGAVDNQGVVLQNARPLSSFIASGR